MVIVTITRWKEKLLFTLVGILIIVGIGWGLSAAVPSGELEEDIFTQPVKVQNDINEEKIDG
ncbi:MAG: hypothetical protein ACOX2X_03675 [Peptococcia bacterium]|jgi:hypothetical protein